MQQRPLQLGDILDDYCPRERHLTNHVIAAMIEDQITHTRCTTCDAEHDYKQARMPVQRKRAKGESVAVVAAKDSTVRVVLPVEEDMSKRDSVVPESAEVPAEAETAVPPLEVSTDGETRPPEDDGPVHRRLIRATFPRPEGQPPEWKEPEFTIRQPGGSQRNRFGQGEANGNRSRQSRGWGGRGSGGSQGQPGGGSPRSNQNRPGGGGRPGGQGGQGGQGGRRRGR
jgi:hypothetical protein